MFSFKNKLLLFISVSLIIFTIACAGNDVQDNAPLESEAVASVNGEEIPMNLLQHQVESMKQFYAQQGLDLESDEHVDTLQEIRMDLLNDIVRERVLVQEADTHDIKPSEEEIDIAVEQMLVEYEATEEELKESMQELGYTDDMFRNEVADQLKIQQLTTLEHLDTSDFNITEENLRAYYDEVLEIYGEEIGEYDEIIDDLEASYVWDSYVQQLMEEAEIEIYI